MEKLLKEIENNLRTLQCRLEKCDLEPVRIEVDLWNNSIGFELGVFGGVEWLGGTAFHSISSFLKAVERKRILFRKFNGGV